MKDKVSDHKFVFYFIPIFIATYFFVALIPVVQNKKVEIFPFFSFKLFSKIPNGFEKMDVVFDLGKENERFLIYRNNDLTIMETNFLNLKMSEISKQFDENNEQEKKEFLKMIKAQPNQSVTLVKMKGDLVENYKDGKYDLEIIQIVKE